MHMGFLFTNKCNVHCDHCSTDCGPQQNGRMSLEKIKSLMGEAAALSGGDRSCFSISGGEPFLFWGDLLEMVSFGTALGATMTCVTNGYWAATYDKGLKKTRALRAAGLQLLAISTSQYHQKFIPIEKVRFAARAAIDAGLQLVIKYPYTRSSLQPTDMAELLGSDIMEHASMEFFSVMPHVRTGFEVAFDSMLTEPGIPQGRCPAAVVTVREDGQAYTCCIPGAFVDPLKLGCVNNDRLALIKDRFEGGDVQQLLFAEGPHYIAQKAKENGLGSFFPESFTGICHLCTHIFEDSRLRDFAQSVAEDYQLQRLGRNLAGAPGVNKQAMRFLRKTPD